MAAGEGLRRIRRAGRGRKNQEAERFAGIVAWEAGLGNHAVSALHGGGHLILFPAIHFHQELRLETPGLGVVPRHVGHGLRVFLLSALSPAISRRPRAAAAPRACHIRVFHSWGIALRAAAEEKGGRDRRLVGDSGVLCLLDGVAYSGPRGRLIARRCHEPVHCEEYGAKFRIKRTERIEGVTCDITYCIYFGQEEDGSWKILNY